MPQPRLIRFVSLLLNLLSALFVLRHLSRSTCAGRRAGQHEATEPHRFPSKLTCLQLCCIEGLRKVARLCPGR
ncbi:hypothetical protein BDW66DRAFT_138336 [Aspergillus desertorum]